MVLETKGYDPLAEVKKIAAERWVAAVNAQSTMKGAGRASKAVIRRNCERAIPMGLNPNYGTDVLRNTGIALENASLVDFWKWAFSDLCDDVLKGYFAEWIVAKLLDIPSTRRIGWANSDIITPEGVRIEVKASSYWQSWKILDEMGAIRPSPLHPITDKTRIAFAGLKARDAVAVPDPKVEPKLKSHIYVFAFQHETDINKWNAMDLQQWEFYVLPVKRLQQIGWRSIPLTMLRSEQNPLTAFAFIEKAKLLIAETARDIRLQEENGRP